VREVLPKVAAVLRESRQAVAEALAEPLLGWDKFASVAEEMGRGAFVEWETIPLADYLIRALGEGGAEWRHLFLGERMKQLHWPADALEELIERRDAVFLSDRAALGGLLEGKVPAVELEQFLLRMDAWRELVTTKARASREVKILLVGDCLFLDITTFLSALLLERGLTIRPVFAGSKNPVELRNTLRGMASERFELVCYSPYTYEMSLPLARTHALEGMKSGPGALRALAAEAHGQMVPTLRLLRETFECNVFVHRTANIRRHEGMIGSYAKQWGTRWARSFTGREVDALLDKEMLALNAEAGRPVVAIDEMALKRQFGEMALGTKFYSSEPVHPTVLSLKLAEVYRDLIGAVSGLTGRKVVVVDLDHTVWHGVIGEGAVVHDHGRQGVLKRLREKGVVLAIASKNDARNVNWVGGVLTDEDFVARQIHWEPKSVSIRRIADELNLKVKDFVFIDDRADEREMAGAAHKGLLTLDATDDATWRMLGWWAEMLGEQTEADRTQMYAERKARQGHLEAVAEVEDMGAVLTGLGLRVAIREAGEKELGRAEELINRTNQFNVRGSRVTRAQVLAWHRSETARVLVAEAADKFGGMGIVSVMVMEGEEIVAWVLSCRVFGFGIETALLNEARRGSPGVRGTVVETANNQPCREVFAVNGFSLVDGVWEWRGGVVPRDPEWLTVTVG
jgi:FkbH-like protein